MDKNRLKLFVTFNNHYLYMLIVLYPIYVIFTAICFRYCLNDVEALLFPFLYDYLWDDKLKALDIKSYVRSTLSWRRDDAI